MLLPCLAVTPVIADDEGSLGVISWFVFDMTVKEAKELSPAILSVSDNGGNAKSAGDTIATGDTVYTANGSYEAVVRGDVSGDGRLDTTDYLYIKRYILGTARLSDSQKLSADVNSDGKPVSSDYLLAKRIVLGTYTLERPVNASEVPVLLYHHILPDDLKERYLPHNNITIATSEFTRHMQMLVDNGIYTASVTEVYRYVRGEILLPERTVCLCFDDGYKSNTEFAAAILAEFGFQATVFSIMSFYEGDYQNSYDPSSLQHITVTDLEPWEGVIDQQCHTWSNHNHLPEQSYTQIYNDLMLSQNCRKYDYFAYPYGDYSDTVIRAVKAAGFKAAFTTVPRNAVPGDNVYLIPRHTITSPMQDSMYQSLITSGYAD